MEGRFKRSHRPSDPLGPGPLRLRPKRTGGQGSKVGRPRVLKQPKISSPTAPQEAPAQCLRSTSRKLREIEKEVVEAVEKLGEGEPAMIN